MTVVAEALAAFARRGDGTRAPWRVGRLAAMDKRRLTTALGKYLVNPIVRAAVALRLAPPTYAILETTGRKSGLPRQTPVGNGLDGATFWLVAEHGHQAQYVRNIAADPRVRVKIRGRWRTGTAHPLPDDDPRVRLRKIGLRVNGAVVQLMGTDLLTVRIDLDP
ncbi:MAG: nitroreductase/quinone reductase family protein [Pseudonocardiaceae bacterium]